MRPRGGRGRPPSTVLGFLRRSVERGRPRPRPAAAWLAPKLGDNRHPSVTRRGITAVSFSWVGGQSTELARRDTPRSSPPIRSMHLLR